jgi:hypothetical protein
MWIMSIDAKRKNSTRSIYKKWPDVIPGLTQDGPFERATARFYELSHVRAHRAQRSYGPKQAQSSSFTAFFVSLDATLEDLPGSICELPANVSRFASPGRGYSELLGCCLK